MLNAAILGFYYGIWGTLAYAMYYLSFLTGGKIVDSLRFQHGYENVQGFLYARFGSWGTGCYNFVVAIRLISEVFANLLVIGILFGVSIPFAVTYFSGIPTITSTWSVIVAFGISVLTGVIFGVYPARKAARMNPIEALRQQ